MMRFRAAVDDHDQRVVFALLERTDQQALHFQAVASLEGHWLLLDWLRSICEEFMPGE